MGGVDVVVDVYAAELACERDDLGCRKVGRHHVGAFIDHVEERQRIGVVEHLLDDGLDELALVAHPGVVAVIELAAAAVEQRRLAVEALVARIERDDVVEVLVIVHVLVDIDPDAAQGIGDVGQPIEVDLGVV